MGEMNDKRAEWAFVALEAFMVETGQTDHAEALGDLMGDFMHMVDRHEIAEEIAGSGVVSGLTVEQLGHRYNGVETLRRFFDRGINYYTEGVDEDE